MKRASSLRFVQLLVGIVFLSTICFACSSLSGEVASGKSPASPTWNPGSPPSSGCLAASFRAMVMFQADSIPHDYIAFGHVRGYMYVLRKKGSGFSHAWSSFYLGSSVKEILADDVDGDNIVDLVVITSAGRMFIFDTNTRQMVWENTVNDFESVTTAAIGQLDNDRAKELVLCADSRLVVMDGETLIREYQSADEFTAEYLVIGDVDDDDEKEIVLDSGFIINAKTLNIEWQTDPFGTRLTLVDIDADGVDELVCESTGGALRVYDLDIRQEKTVY